MRLQLLLAFLALSFASPERLVRMGQSPMAMVAGPQWEVTIKDIGMKVTAARLYQLDASDKSAYLAIECQGVNTVFFLSSALAISSLRVGITIRIGDSPGKRFEWPSTDNGRIGLFASDEAIPFINALP